MVGLLRLLCLSRGGGRVRGKRSRDRVVGGGGGVGAWLRLVARSRHYTGRHFLSDLGEERRGSSALRLWLFQLQLLDCWQIPVLGVGRGRAYLPRLVARAYLAMFVVWRMVTEESRQCFILTERPCCLSLNLSKSCATPH